LEPILPTFHVLEANVKRLGLDNVTTIHAASSDCTKADVMIVPRINGANNFYRAQIRRNGGLAPGEEVFAVRSRPLDELIPSQTPVALLKVDVEGHELASIRGAISLIKRWTPALLVEASGDPELPDGSLELFDLLRSLQYQVYIARGIALTERTSGQRSTNYFFLQPRHCDRLRGKLVSLV
jgi:FkbM family methyltransferase